MKRYMSIVLGCLVITSGSAIHALNPMDKLRVIDTLVHLSPDYKKQGWLLIELEEALKRAELEAVQLDFSAYDPQHCIDLVFLTSGRLIRAYELESLFKSYKSAQTQQEYKQSVEHIYTFIKKCGYTHASYALGIQERVRAGEHINSWRYPVEVAAIMAVCVVLVGSGYTFFKYILPLLSAKDIKNTTQESDKSNKLPEYKKPEKSSEPVSSITLTNTITEKQVYHHIEKKVGWKNIVRDNYPNVFKVTVNGTVVFEGKTIVAPNIQVAPGTRIVEVVYELDWKIKELIDEMVKELSPLPASLVRTFAEREIKNRNPEGSTIRSRGAKKITYELPEGYASCNLVFTSWDDDKRPGMITPGNEDKKDLITRKYDLVQIPHATKIKEEIVFAEPKSLFNHPKD